MIIALLSSVLWTIRIFDQRGSYPLSKKDQKRGQNYQKFQDQLEIHECHAIPSEMRGLLPTFVNKNTDV